MEIPCNLNLVFEPVVCKSLLVSNFLKLKDENTSKGIIVR